jgi:ferredoxin
VFELRDDGFLYVLDDSPPTELHKRVEDAMYDCPSKAISLQR